MVRFTLRFLLYDLDAQGSWPGAWIPGGAAGPEVLRLAGQLPSRSHAPPPEFPSFDLLGFVHGWLQGLIQNLVSTTICGKDLGPPCHPPLDT